MYNIDLSVIIIFLIVIIIYCLLYLKSIYGNNKDINSKINTLLNGKENFIVADAQDFHNYDALRENVKKMPDNFNKSNIVNPPKDNMVDYDQQQDKDSEFKIMVVNGEPKRVDDKKNEKSYITATDFGWDAPFPMVSCGNSSIDRRFKTGKTKLLPYQINCGFPNKITGENYYKTYQAMPIKIEDQMVKGANYMEYTDYVHPSKLNIRILSQNTKGLPPDETKYKNVPTGYNYAFHNTPIVSMP